ncbi:MAG TPA: hypothetical protein VEY95_08605 [Azospirillaceae bacterium]|nr:hypothetical protein [Azospirillaceae bacterium]
MGFFSPVVVLVATLCLSGLVGLEIISALRKLRMRQSRARMAGQLAKLVAEVERLGGVLAEEEPKADALYRRSEDLRRRLNDARDRLRKLQSSRIVYVYELGTPDFSKDLFVSHLKLVHKRADGPMAELTRSRLWEFQNIAEIWARDVDEAQRQANLVFSAEVGVTAGPARPLRETLDKGAVA